MRAVSLTVAIAFVLGTVPMTSAGMAFENHGGWGGKQFVWGAFGHPFHKRSKFHRTVVIPYAYDYDYPADAFADAPIMAPPAVPQASMTTACHRNVETFTVPAQDGGTRQVTIINCP